MTTATATRLAIGVLVFFLPLAMASAQSEQATDASHAGANTHEAAAPADAHVSGEHGGQGIPMSVTFQAINFAIFAGLAYYFLRHPVRTFFANRKENFRQALIKAEHAKREAEMRKQEVRERLAKLELTSRETVAQARAEAESLRGRILQDAQDLTRTVREETGRTVEAELARAKAQLRDELLSQSVTLSKKILAEKINNEPDQKRLQTEFVDKVAQNISGAR